MSSAIEAQDLVFEYPGKRALDNVSFRIEPASIVALVGPNGAGKTTLLRCLAALDRPYAGNVRISGIDSQVAPRDCHRKLGYLSDSFGLYDDLSVKRCLLHQAAIHGAERPEQEQRCNAITDLLGIQSLLMQRAGSLSRGQRQKVGIAQALIHNPEVLLLDEPASGLDPEARHDLAVVLRKLRDCGMTILVSSHILAELEDYSDSMLTLRNGQIVGHLPVGRTQDNDVRTLDLKVISDPILVEPLLRTISGIQSITRREQTITVQFSGSEEQQAEILRVLISAGILVSSFSEVHTGMQALYLSQLSNKKGI